ncbi:MAG: 2-succinyl-5-enolpyruvyl-6-hydroxy-3-cyclohexene-1-carboxylic-acid synthase [Muribaculaceae bacterium]|nr:2-succinyl-5-enolpyruvyl-6-hydroxy-3-cyclohexene-1-carboxylic-acid synthase [Muribaculaceae bacterium]
METIDKPTAQILAALLRAYGVRHVVLSPGSRSAPLAVVFARSGFFDIKVIIDERAAAFAGLGMALQLQEPVALVCTSGSAVLNYAPALAEAFYRRVPLIAISADRPAALIDQRDTQTIRQPEALRAVVRASVDIPDADGAQALRFAWRRLNDALSAATGPVCGPVHINMQFDVPLTRLAPARTDLPVHRIEAVRSSLVPDEVLEGLMQSIPAESRVLLVAGDMHPSARLKELLSRLSGRVAVLAEAQSNLGGNIMASHPDMSTLPQPDIVVSMGGSLVSARVKAYLRSLPQLRHISLGPDDLAVDTFFALAERVECEPEIFFEALEKRLMPCDEFVKAWRECFTLADADKANGVRAMLQSVVDSLPDAAFHFSNGSAVRYAQLLSFGADNVVESNRGVSGIDGCTSTAVGASLVSSRPTVLVSGDMSAAYDIGALAIDGIPASFKMIVLDNGGGDIFRAISATSTLPECEELFACRPRLPLKALAQAYGFAYFEADTSGDLSEFINCSHAPAILRAKLEVNAAKCVL